MMKLKLILLQMFLLAAMEVFAMPFPWKPVSSQPEAEIKSVYTDSRNPGIIFAVSRNGTYFRSVDWGAQWIQLTPPGNLAVDFLVASPTMDETWFCVGHSGSNWQLWVSHTNGNEWRKLTATNQTITAISPSPSRSDLLLGIFSSGSSRFLVRSEDSGVTWTQCIEVSGETTPPVWHTSSAWEAFCGLFSSEDYGRTWTRSEIKSIQAAGFDLPPTLYAANSDGFFATNDNRRSWWPLLSSPTDFVVLNPRNPDQIITGLQNSADQQTAKIYFSSDHGKSFLEWDNGLPGRFDSIALAADWLFFATRDGTIYKYDERPADIDHSNRIDGGDLVILARAFGSATGDARYDASADINHDGTIDGNDLLILSLVWGHRFSYSDDQIPGDFTDE